MTLTPPCRGSAAAFVGHETVQYVGNIYEYYVAYVLATGPAAKRANAPELIETKSL
jgi:hypothetical protein